MKKICIIAGTRPVFIMTAKLYKILKHYPRDFDVILVNTGQHYSKIMTDAIFNDLKVTPDYNLDLQLSNRWSLILGIKSLLEKKRPDFVIVFGDDNSAFAGAWVAKTLGIGIIHIEAGMRSGDWRMPEEMNRYFIDSIGDILFCPDQEAALTLGREFNKDGIIVGNIKNDSLLSVVHLLKKEYENPYAVVTLHRAENIDDRKQLIKILKALNEISQKISLKIMCHPRFDRELDNLSTSKYYYDNYIIPISSCLLPPLSYIEFLNLIYNSKFVITDSGGLQTDSVMLCRPCITFRISTEWTFTLNYGNRLARDINELLEIVDEYTKVPSIGPCLNNELIATPWGDGNTSERIVDYLLNEL